MKLTNIYLSIIASLFLFNGYDALAQNRTLTRSEVESKILGNTYQVLQDRHTTGVFYIWTKDNQSIVAGYKTFTPTRWHFVGDQLCYDGPEKSCVSMFASESGEILVRWNQDGTGKLWTLTPESSLESGKLGYLQILKSNIGTYDHGQDSREDKLKAAKVREIIDKEMNVEKEKFSAEKARIAADPVNILGSLYRSYAFVKACFEARKSYAAVYVSEVELNDARRQIKSLETYYKPKVPGSDTDAIWDKYTKDLADLKDTSFGFEVKRDLCQGDLRNLRNASSKIDGSSNRTVKDF